MSEIKIDRFRYEYILKTAGEERIRVKLRDEHYTGRRVMKMELSKMRERGRLKREINRHVAR